MLYRHVPGCVLPVSMWSTELNMWSDVRGKLLTLRPLSVLSLREWALHKNRKKTHDNMTVLIDLQWNCANVNGNKTELLKGKNFLDKWQFSSLWSLKMYKTKLNMNSPIKSRFVVWGSDPDIQGGDECLCIPVRVQTNGDLVPSSCVLKHRYTCIFINSGHSLVQKFPATPPPCFGWSPLQHTWFKWRAHYQNSAEMGDDPIIWKRCVNIGIVS